MGEGCEFRGMEIGHQCVLYDPFFRELTIMSCERVVKYIQRGGSPLLFPSSLASQ